MRDLIHRRGPSSLDDPLFVAPPQGITKSPQIRGDVLRNLEVLSNFLCTGAIFIRKLDFSLGLAGSLPVSSLHSISTRIEPMSISFVDIMKHSESRGQIIGF